MLRKTQLGPKLTGPVCIQFNAHNRRANSICTLLARAAAVCCAPRRGLPGSQSPTSEMADPGSLDHHHSASTHSPEDGSSDQVHFEHR